MLKNHMCFSIKKQQSGTCKIKSLDGILEDFTIKVAYFFIRVTVEFYTHLFEGKFRMRGLSVHETLWFLSKFSVILLNWNLEEMLSLAGAQGQQKLVSFTLFYCNFTVNLYFFNLINWKRSKHSPREKWLVLELPANTFVNERALLKAVQ